MRTKGAGLLVVCVTRFPPDRLLLCALEPELLLDALATQLRDSGAVLPTTLLGLCQAILG